MFAIVTGVYCILRAIHYPVLLQGLSPNKATGPDEISPKIRKELHYEIAPILTLIFTVPLET